MPEINVCKPVIVNKKHILTKNIFFIALVGHEKRRWSQDSFDGFMHWMPR
jgi:hypothetical protein